MWSCENPPLAGSSGRLRFLWSFLISFLFCLDVHPKVDVAIAITRSSEQNPPGLISYLKWPSPPRELSFLERRWCFPPGWSVAPRRWVPVPFLWVGSPLLCPLLAKPRQRRHTAHGRPHFPSREVAPCLSDEVFGARFKLLPNEPHSSFFSFVLTFCPVAFLEQLWWRTVPAPGDRALWKCIPAKPFKGWSPDARVSYLLLGKQNSNKVVNLDTWSNCVVPNPVDR